MTNILRVELFRLKKSRLFWVFLIVCTALAVGGALILFVFDKLFESMDMPMDVLFESMGMEVTAQSFLAGFTQFSADSTIFAIICSAIVLSREFTQGTMRNVILANKTRSQMFFAYYIVALVIGVTYFAADFAVSLVLYGAMFGFGSVQGGAAATAVLCLFVMGLFAVLFAETCVCTFLFVTRKQAATAVLPLVICLLAPNIISSFETLVLFAVEAGGHTVSETALYFLPFYNFNMLDANKPAGLCMVMILVYDLLLSGGMFCLGYFPFLKADLK